MILPEQEKGRAVVDCAEPYEAQTTVCADLFFNILNRADSGGRQVCRGRSHSTTSQITPGAV
jgi:hypothetical protein